MDDSISDGLKSNDESGLCQRPRRGYSHSRFRGALCTYGGAPPPQSLGNLFERNRELLKLEHGMKQRYRPYVLREFRDAVDYIRKTAWAVQEWQRTGSEADTARNSAAVIERIRRGRSSMRRSPRLKIRPFVRSRRDRRFIRAWNAFTKNEAIELGSRLIEDAFLKRKTLKRKACASSSAFTIRFREQLAHDHCGRLHFPVFR